MRRCSVGIRCGMKPSIKWSIQAQLKALMAITSKSFPQFRDHNDSVRFQELQNNMTKIYRPSFPMYFRFFDDGALSQSESIIFDQLNTLKKHNDCHESILYEKSFTWSSFDGILSEISHRQKFKKDLALSKIPLGSMVWLGWWKNKAPLFWICWAWKQGCCESRVQWCWAVDENSKLRKSFWIRILSTKGEIWRRQYGILNLERVIDKLWIEIKPLYQLLHGFVRHR